MEQISGAFLLLVCFRATFFGIFEAVFLFGRFFRFPPKKIKTVSFFLFSSQSFFQYHHEAQTALSEGIARQRNRRRAIHEETARFLVGRLDFQPAEAKSICDVLLVYLFS
jgi:hypothetical protein